MRALLLHLRLPFSFLLLPPFLFALADAAQRGVPIDWRSAGVLFVALHLFIYPASQAYNSSYDRDEGPIGGLARPPQVTDSLAHTLRRVALAMDLAGLGLASLLGLRVGALVAAYILVSRAYSSPLVRLKARPWLGWIAVMVFQGGVVFATTSLAATGAWPSPVAALAMALLIGSGYPLTQVYQHEEDQARGDRTLSLALGVRGTFYFAHGVAALALGLLSWHIIAEWRMGWGAVAMLGLTMAPTLVELSAWTREVFRSSTALTHARAMRMTLLSTLGLIAASLLATGSALYSS